MPLKISGVPVLVAAMTVVFSAGCDDPAAPITPDVPRAGSSLSGADHTGTGKFQNLHDEFAHLSAVVPGGFGGLFYDAGGRPTVYLTDVSQRDVALAALLPLLRARRASLPGGRRPDLAHIQVLRGEYSFPDLARWRRAINGQAGGIPGILLTDVDEVKNRVVLGVEDPGTAEQAVADAVRRLGIPAGAVLVERSARPRMTASLQDDAVPAVSGGYWIQWTDSRFTAGVGMCSLGFNAWRNDPVYGREGVFVTASHCSRTKWAPDANNYFYQWRTSGTPIGYEIADPRPFKAGTNGETDCPSGSYCRWSDALAALWTAPRWDFGKVAHTTAPNNGSLTIHATEPVFSILDEIAYPVVGEEVQRVGRSTGWAIGTVTRTCIDGYEGNTVLLCQDDVAYDVSAAGGDSGGPVFSASLYPGWVYLRGVQWSGSGTFSSMYNVEMDLGAMETMRCDSNPERLC
ncbi:MAG: hypothetical protein AVDCRST_MAG68-2167 [uncultured Gemmatimonadetes bacterium]|uniref:Uncharacterized protein n=1 Tax=uncultured Gemmatimonadota bacterium TaxID=203437 RepID=A0A6J4L9N7_9BACT|nr:MAG: hypothetical protein AVDCRST_MAG68-2167 [uncultured Gemmatimonadota bacterium]